MFILKNVEFHALYDFFIASSSSYTLHCVCVCGLCLRASDPVLDEKCQHPAPPLTPVSLSPGVWLLNYEAESLQAP